MYFADTKILEVKLFAFTYRLSHEDFSMYFAYLIKMVKPKQRALQKWHTVTIVLSFIVLSKTFFSTTC